MNTPVHDRMFLNAAIDRLVKGESDDWLNDAQVVVDFGLGIPASPRIRVDSLKIEANYPAAGQNAYAAGIGDIGIDDGESHTVRRVGNTEVERVGHYKLVHIPEVGALTIEHYQSGSVWKSPETGDDAGYQVRYSSRANPELFLRLTLVEIEPLMHLEIRLLLGRLKDRLVSATKFYWNKLVNPAARGMKRRYESKGQYFVYQFEVVYSVREDITVGSRYLGGVPI